MSAQDDEPAVRVTLSTVYNKLLDVDKKLDPVPAVVADHETRIRILERRVWMAAGLAAGVGMGGGALLSKFSQILGS